MIALRITFRPEKRKSESGIVSTSNIPLLADINLPGRWTTTGIVLNNIDDFDSKLQKLKSGKRSKYGSFTYSATQTNIHLEEFKNNILNAFKDLRSEGLNPIHVKDVKSKAYPKNEVIRIESAGSIILKRGEFYLKSKLIKSPRFAKYTYLSRMMDRYEKIKGLKVNLAKLTIEEVVELRDFVINECDYVSVYPDLYKDEKRRPTEMRNLNTASSYIKVLSTVLTDLKYFNPITDSTRAGKAVLSEKYDEVFFLSIDELLSILQKDYPTDLKLDRDSFIVQCGIGLRVEDYWKYSQDPVLTSTSGIKHIRYTASKTMDNKKYIEVIETPLVKYVADIVAEYGALPFRNYDKGARTTKYNQNIRRLLKYWRIDRPVVVRNGDGGIEKVPIHEVASNKLARKTFVDIINKSQLNPYLAGVHKEGSAAVRRYTDLTLEDKYKLYSIAFRQPI